MSDQDLTNRAGRRKIGSEAECRWFDTSSWPTSIFFLLRKSFFHLFFTFFHLFFCQMPWHTIMLRPGAIFNNGPLMASDSKRTIRRLLALTDNYNLSQKNSFQISYTLSLNIGTRTKSASLFWKVLKACIQCQFFVKRHKQHFNNMTRSP